jgi:hypothetical protein
MNKTFDCVLCGKTSQGFGNNALPVAQGRCCDRCDHLVVLPARLSAHSGEPPEHFKDWAEEIHALSKFYKAINKSCKNGNNQ